MQKLKNMRIGLIELCATLIISGLMIVTGIILGLNLASLIIKLFSGLLKPPAVNFNFIKDFLQVSWGVQAIMLLTAVIMIGGIIVTYNLTRTILKSVAAKEDASTIFQKHSGLRIIEMVLGLVLVVTGYFILNLPSQNLFNTLLAAFVTIVSGTYLLCHSLLSLVPATWFSKIKLAKGKTQLGLHHYASVFTIISILFALTMGALALSHDFNAFSQDIKRGTYYDGVIVSNTANIKNDVAQLKIKKQQTYHYKDTKGHFYFVRNELVDNPVKYVKSTGKRNFQVKLIKLDQLNKNSLAGNSFRELVPNSSQKDKTIALCSAAELNKVKGNTKYLTLVQLNSFDRDWPFLLKIEHKQAQSSLTYSRLYSSSKAALYQLALGMTREMKILGFSMAFVFGATLFAILIIEVIKFAKKNRDADQKLKTQKVSQESSTYGTGLLLLVPAVFGVFDALFGLKIFNQVLPTAYYEIWLPIMLMILSYFVLCIMVVFWRKKAVF
ncbi:hypothetical protein H3U50_04065 [Lactobacillus sp. M0398]|uniref:hypothetical protein n=1 Tax=unclassified Lactobacillus TaxID=2620435 RepID=UPI0018DDB85E|nr:MULTISPECIES: hypothetical protein [unclassified Lactobacillus]MBI0033654.1 hypothetical protein [Lactobacillus sp. M0396]MBI0120990.1 hypothetical protein [Lactobacillus sp. M0398]MBI0123137.1 hypothetical protein [Lactobacillus sp. W8174]MBI0135305.1 hypothetical protein [Lactobacillus sp. W8173]